jgi:hypothetical protein
MAFLNLHTSFNLRSESDIFSVPSTQNSIEEGYFQEYRPVSPITENAPIEFVISGQSMEYLDLSFTRLYLKVQVLKNDNTCLRAETPVGKNSNNQTEETITGDVVAPVNNLMNSLFNNIEVYLNKKCVNSSKNLYHYRSYIENLLNYGSEAKSSHLTSIIWEKDTANEMESLNQNGFRKRKLMFASSNIVDLEGVLHCDILNQHKHMLNGVEVMLKLYRNKHQFCLMSTDDEFKIVVKEATLTIRKMKYNPSVMIAHAKTLMHTTAKYPITRVDMKSVSLSKDIQSKYIDNLYLGQMPKRIIVGLLKSDAFNGAIDLNPFNFQHFGLNFINIVTDSYIRCEPYRPDFERGLYVSCYNSLFMSTGIHHGDTGNDISRSEYPYGYCLFPFDLTPDLSAHERHWKIQRTGNLGIELRFSQPLNTTVTVIIFAEFDNLIEIDKDRNIVMDYAS